MAKTIQKANLNQHSSVRTAHIRMHITVHCCSTLQLHNTIQNSSDNLTSYPPESLLTAQMLSTGGRWKLNHMNIQWSMLNTGMGVDLARILGDERADRERLVRCEGCDPPERDLGRGREMDFFAWNGSFWWNLRGIFWKSGAICIGVPHSKFWGSFPNPTWFTPTIIVRISLWGTHRHICSPIWRYSTCKRHC